MRKYTEKLSIFFYAFVYINLLITCQRDWRKHYENAITPEFRDPRYALQLTGS